MAVRMKENNCLSFPLGSVTVTKSYDYPCDLCDRKFSLSKNLMLHRRVAHKEYKQVTLKIKPVEVVKTYNHPCNLCSKKFSNKYNLMYHQKKDHGKCFAKYTCDVCGDTFSNKKKFSTHVKTHKNSNVKNQVCPMCKNNMTKSEILSHLEKNHDITMTKEVLTFENFEKFSQWKEEMKEKYCYNYALRCTNKYKDKNVLHYRCHRSGAFVSKSTGQRHFKTQGSCKTGVFCPSAIKVQNYCDGKCVVDFLSTHLGHENDLCHVPLSKKDKDSLAKKIASGISLDRILNDIKHSESNFERLHLLTKKDLHNIKQSYNLKSMSYQTPKENSSEVLTKLTSSIEIKAEAIVKPFGKNRETKHSSFKKSLRKTKQDYFELNSTTTIIEKLTKKDLHDIEQSYNLHSMSYQTPEKNKVLPKLTSSIENEAETVVKRFGINSEKENSSFKESLQKIKQEYLELFNATTNIEQLMVLKNNLKKLHTSWKAAGKGN